MRRVVVTGAAFLLGLAASWGCSQPHKDADAEAGTRVVSVGAAADLKFALDEAVAEFRRTHPDIDVQVTYSSSGNLFAQLTNRAPFDLFLSADVGYPRRLIDQGLAGKDTEFLYAVGHLVVWVPRDSVLDVERLGIQALLEPSVRKVAIANPAHAPYGRAAEAALKKLGVYDRVRERLVFGDNVAQTAQFVQTGSADVGVIALSLALAPSLRDAGRYWEVPLDAYPRLEQGGVILDWVKDREATQELRDFLTGKEGRALLKKYGFLLPGE
jgi:molybdate transport system substrate-binding protein